MIWSFSDQFPPKCDRRSDHDHIWLPKCDLSSVHDRDLIVIWREKVQFHPSFGILCRLFVIFSIFPSERDVFFIQVIQEIDFYTKKNEEKKEEEKKRFSLSVSLFNNLGGWTWHVDLWKVKCILNNHNKRFDSWVKLKFANLNSNFLHVLVNCM